MAGMYRHLQGQCRTQAAILALTGSKSTARKKDPTVSAWHCYRLSVSDLC
uniref:Uncharacterized protein n=1 Tax=Aegilops tauschii subsp. strangulata TaxID=200361 RepID=A0A453JEK6_AEGTS